MSVPPTDEERRALAKQMQVHLMEAVIELVDAAGIAELLERHEVVDVIAPAVEAIRIILAEDGVK